MRNTLLACLLSVLAISCGGGSDVDEGASTSPGIDADQLTTRASGRLGPEGAFDAVVFALERGYSVDQVVESIDGASLLADGRIAEAEPDGPALDFVQLPESARRGSGNTVLISIRAQEPVPIDEFRRLTAALYDKEAEREEGLYNFIASTESVAQDSKNANLYLILLLAQAGLSGDQILEYVLFGPEAALESTREKLRQQIEGIGAGSVSQSSEDEVEVASPTLPLEPAASDLAGTYIGEMTLYQCTVTCDTQCEVHGPITIRLMPDGTIIGSTGASADFNGAVCVDPLGVGPPIRGMWEPSSARLDITVEAAIGTIGPAILSLIVEGSEATVTLLEDTREGDQARIVQLDAVLTRQ